jgi:hypothetical protein
MERVYPHGFLKREGMAYRTNVRSSLWLVILAVVCGLIVWWAWT